MYSLKLSLVFTLLFAWMVDAGLYVINPFQGSECRASQPCTVTWLDDGRAPLLSAIGVTTVGLYTGSQQLVQVLPPVNVATDHSLIFTPISEAGPNSDNYYISFASTELKVNDSAYRGYSPFFSLTGMSGSFGSTLPSATSVKPIPSSLTQTRSSSSTSTITVGTLNSTPSLQPVTTPTTSISSPIPRFTTSFVSSSSSSTTSSSSLLPSSSSSSSSTPFPSSTAQSKAVGLTTSPTILLPSSLLISTLLSWFLRMLYS